MKFLIISDIHGNSDALESILAEPEVQECREIWCLGDVAGYGPEPGKCFNILRDRNALFIPGNHDLYFAGKFRSDFFSSEASAALILTASKVGQDFRQLMGFLPVKVRRKGFTLVHGSLINPPTDYILTAEDAYANFKLLKGKGIIYGHTHKQGFFVNQNGVILWSRPKSGESVTYRNRKILFNPGSVGQPRDGDPRAAWAVLNSRTKEVFFYRTSYDIEAYQKKMRDIDASEFLISRVAKGL